MRWPTAPRASRTKLAGPGPVAPSAVRRERWGAQAAAVCDDLDGGGGTEMVLRTRCARFAQTGHRSHQLDDAASLAAGVTWRRCRLASTGLVKWIAYWIAAVRWGSSGAARTRLRSRGRPGASFPSRWTPITMHFCHAGYVEAVGGMSTGRRGWRRVQCGGVATACPRDGMVVIAAATARRRARGVSGIAVEVEFPYGRLPVTSPRTVVTLPARLRPAIRSPPGHSGRSSWVATGPQGLGLAIQALARMPERHPHCRRGGADAKDRRSPAAAGVRDRVMFAGYRTMSVRSWTVDVLVLASAYGRCHWWCWSCRSRVVPGRTDVSGVDSVVRTRGLGPDPCRPVGGRHRDALNRCDADRSPSADVGRGA